MTPTTETSTPVDYRVRRDDYSKGEFTTGPKAEEIELGPDEALLRIAKFAFTANNITYAVVGEMIGYWNFFPAEEGWGRIPVWGIGVVERSNAEGMKEGDRFFGYYPMSTHLKVKPVKVSPAGFIDGAEHRQALPPTYNNYRRMTLEGGFDPKYDDLMMIFWPLFMTGFVIDDFLADNDFFGAKSVVFSSASSKTSFGTAFQVSQRGDGPGQGRPEIIGLTSPGNKAFTEGLGCYDRVVTYDEVGTLDAATPTTFVDMAGNADVVSAVHNHFADNLRYSCLVGMTHWQDNKPAAGLPGPAPAMFFAPTQIEKRGKDWGPGGLQERFGKAWEVFMEPVARCITVVHGEGQDAVERVYQDTLAARAKPNEGHVLEM